MRRSFISKLYLVLVSVEESGDCHRVKIVFLVEHEPFLLRLVSSASGAHAYCSVICFVSTLNLHRPCTFVELLQDIVDFPLRNPSQCYDITATVLCRRKKGIL